MDNSLKDKVLATVDIVEVVGERVTLKRQGKDYVGLCPFHADHRPSMSVSPAKQIFKCWACGAGGDVIRFIQLADRTDFKTALATLARRAGIEIQTTGDERSSAQREQLRAALHWAREHFRRNLAAPAGQRAQDYAARRGLSAETVSRYELGLAMDAHDDLLATARRTGLALEVLVQAGLVGTSDSGSVYDRFRNRLIFPILDAAGRPVAFGGRTLGDDRAKYLNSPETALFSKSRVLYGLSHARNDIISHKTVIVVEGYMDAVLLAQFGFTNVVATLGTALTEAHVRLLAPLADTIYLCFDGDAAGAKAADRGVEVALRTDADVRVVLLDGHKDPADCVTAGGSAAFEACLKGAVDALEFKWRQVLTELGADDQRARRVALEKYLDFVAAATASGGIDPLQRTLLVDRLSETLGVRAEAIFDLLARRRLVQRSSSAANDPASAGASAYDTSIAGLPGGLVAATEEVLGLLLENPDCWRLVSDQLARAVEYSRTWSGVYALFLELQDEFGEYSLGQVVARCEDSASCELVSRARARTVGSDEPATVFAAASARLAFELSLLRQADLQQSLRQASSPDGAEGTFEALVKAARGRDAVLPAVSRWATPGPVGGRSGL